MTHLHSIIINLLFLVRLVEEDSEIVVEIIPVIFDLLSNFETADSPAFFMDHEDWLYLYAEIRKKIAISNSKEKKRLWNQLSYVLTTEKEISSDPKKRFYPLYLSIKKLELEGTTHSFHKLSKSSHERVMMQWVDLECSYIYEFERFRTEEEIRKRCCILAREELSRDYFHDHVLTTTDEDQDAVGDEYVEPIVFARAWILRMRKKWKKHGFFPRTVTVKVIESMSESELAQLYTYVDDAETLWKSLHQWDELQAFHVTDPSSSITKTELQSIVDLFHITPSNVEEFRRQSRLTVCLGNTRKEVFNRQTKFRNSIEIDYKALVSKYSEQAELLTFLGKIKEEYSNYLTKYIRALIQSIPEADEGNYFYDRVLNIYENRFRSLRHNSELSTYYTKSLYVDSPVSFLYKKGLEIWQRNHNAYQEKCSYSTAWSTVLSNIDRKLLQQATLSEYKLQTIAHFMDHLLSLDFPVLALSPFFSDSVSVINKFIDMMAADPIIDVATQGIHGEAISMIAKLFWFKQELSYNVHRFQILSMLHGRSEYAIISKSVLELYEQGNQVDSFLELLGLFVREGLPEMTRYYHVIEEAVKQRTLDTCDDKIFRYLESLLNLFLNEECGEESIVTILQLNSRWKTMLKNFVFALKAFSMNQPYLYGE